MDAKRGDQPLEQDRLENSREENSRVTSWLSGGLHPRACRTTLVKQAFPPANSTWRVKRSCTGGKGKKRKTIYKLNLVTNRYREEQIVVEEIKRENKKRKKEGIYYFNRV